MVLRICLKTHVEEVTGVLPDKPGGLISRNGGHKPGRASKPNQTNLEKLVLPECLTIRERFNVFYSTSMT